MSIKDNTMNHAKPPKICQKCRVAIVVTDDDGVRLILKRSERTLEDAFAAANEVSTCINRHSTLQAMSEFIT